jgi:hypothetical protein
MYRSVEPRQSPRTSSRGKARTYSGSVGVMTTGPLIGALPAITGPFTPTRRSIAGRSYRIEPLFLGARPGRIPPTLGSLAAYRNAERLGSAPSERLAKLMTPSGSYGLVCRVGSLVETATPSTESA